MQILGVKLRKILIGDKNIKLFTQIEKKIITSTRGGLIFFKTPKLPLFHLNFSHFWLTISLSFSVWRSLLPLIYFSLFDWKEKTVDKAIIGIFRFFLCFIFLLLLFLTDIEWKKIRMWKRKLKLGLENGCFKKKKK